MFYLKQKLAGLSEKFYTFVFILHVILLCYIIFIKKVFKTVGELLHLLAVYLN